MKFETEVVEIIERTHDVKSFRFSRASFFEYKAGQFMFVTIRDGSGEMKKHFSISSSPTEKDFLEFTKKLTGSPFSNALSSLKIGNNVKIDGPYGNFTLDSEKEKVGMLSGGIGITPLRSMCKYSIDMKLETNIILLYGNNTVKDIVFKKEFETMQKENSNLKVVHTLTTPPSEWKGYTGYVDAGMIRGEIPDYADRIFYTCGPPAMVKAMDSLLRNLKIPKEQIRKENFSGY